MLPTAWANTKPMSITPVTAMIHFLPTAVCHSSTKNGLRRDGRLRSGLTEMSGLSGGAGCVAVTDGPPDREGKGGGGRSGLDRAGRAEASLTLASGEAGVRTGPARGAQCSWSPPRTQVP